MAKSESEATGPPALRRNLLFAATASVVVAGVVAVVVPWSGRKVPPLQPAPVVVATPPPVAPAAVSPQPTLPSFDIVRVNPEGRAVFAGRAAPHATVTIIDGGNPLGQATADDSGQFVFLPDAPLPVGGQQLTLSARTADGVEAKSESALLLLVPDRAPDARDQPPAPLAVVTPPEGPPHMLATVPDAPAAPAPGAEHRRLALEVVDYDDRAEIRFAGAAPANSVVRLYIDNHAAADATADAAGHWSMTAPAALALGVHKLRVDQLNSAGRVMARVEQPFQRVVIDQAAIGRNRVLVQPGQNLWRLARVVYGSGTRYTVIYQANRDQIRDPKLIYAGQAFAVPGATTGSSPDSVAKSR